MKNERQKLLEELTEKARQGAGLDDFEVVKARALMIESQVCLLQDLMNAELLSSSLSKKQLVELMSQIYKLLRTIQDEAEQVCEISRTIQGESKQLIRTLKVPIRICPECGFLLDDPTHDEDHKRVLGLEPRSKVQFALIKSKYEMSGYR